MRSLGPSGSLSVAGQVKCERNQSRLLWPDFTASLSCQSSRQGIGNNRNLVEQNEHPLIEASLEVFHSPTEQQEAFPRDS